MANAAGWQRGPVRVPPYLVTAGRARPLDDSLEIEAQVTTTAAGRVELPRLHFETREIVALCEQPHAIVEVAGRLGLHLGVVRILIDDLVSAGHLSVARPVPDAANRAEIIERVIRGLDAIV